MAEYDNAFDGWGSGMDAFGGYGADLGVANNNNFNTWDYDMDAFGGYGADLGMEGFNSDTFDYSIGIDPGNGWDAIGYDESSVLGPNSEEDPFNVRMQSFLRTPFGRVVDKVLSYTPQTRMAMGLAKTGLAASTGNYGPAVGMGVSALTNNPLAGGVANLGTQAAQGRDISGPAGAMIGGMLGSQSPLAGMIGSEIGGMVGQSMRGAGSGVQSGAASTGQSGNNSRGMGSDFAGALANIADIYSSNRASQDLKQNISAMQSGGPKQSLESLYGPDSPYAIQLRQQLERKDAAAGRRSQYGAREVELQARLADAYARAAPSFIQANTMNQNAISQQQMLQAQRRNQTLASIYGLARNSGVMGGIKDMYQNYGLNQNLNYIDNIVPDNSLNNYIPSDVQEWM